MGKHLRTLSLMLVAMLAMAACGGDDADTADDADAAPSEAVTADAGDEEDAAPPTDATTDEAPAEPSEGGEDDSDATEDEAADAPEGAEGLVIGLVNQSLAVAHPAAIGQGAEDRAAEIGVELIHLDGQNDADKQTNDVQDLITRGVDGIMLIPSDSVVAVGMVELANEAGIPIMAVATRVGEAGDDPNAVHPGLIAVVAQDEIEAGRRAGQLVVDNYPDGATIAVVEGAPGITQTQLRQQGFEEALEEAGGDYEIVARQPGNWIPEDAYDACENMLVANPSINVIFSHSDGMTRGCAEAAEEQGFALPDDVGVVGIGGDTFAVDMVERGVALGSVCFKPQTLGATAVDLMVGHLTGERELNGEFVSYDTPAFTSENIDVCTPPQW